VEGNRLLLFRMLIGIIAMMALWAALMGFLGFD
jgi:hypothetical protein